MLETVQNNFHQFQEPELLKEIEEKATMATFEEGTVILRKDSYVKVVPLVCSGLVKVLQEGEEHDILMYYIEPGESCIMSITACFNNEKSKVKAMIEEDAEILLVPADLVIKWNVAYPSWNDFVTTLYRKRFLNLLDGFNSVVYDKIDDRLETYLRQKAEKLGSRQLKVTHKQIAEDLGKAREVISRLLKAMESEGKIELQRGKVILTGL